MARISKTVPVDEHHDICSCGHARCRHDRRTGFVTACVMRDCGCAHFTWERFGEEGKREPV